MIVPCEERTFKITPCRPPVCPPVRAKATDLTSGEQKSWCNFCGVSFFFFMTSERNRERGKNEYRENERRKEREKEIGKERREREKE